MSEERLEYIHGYTREEQERLIAQAEYWREKLILRDVKLLPGESVLEIGCGAGAVLGLFGKSFPDVSLAGIDLQPLQIEYATQHLDSLGIYNVDIRVGDASQLPWDDATFDCIYAIWFLEHLYNPIPILREAYRVLKPGGKIILTETDYRSFLITPDSPDYHYLRDSLSELLIKADGNPYVGQILGYLISSAGFGEVTNLPWGFHYFNPWQNQELRNFVEYMNGWLKPTIPQMTEKLGKDKNRLVSGLEFFCNIPDNPDSAATIIVYRGSGVKPR